MYAILGIFDIIWTHIRVKLELSVLGWDGTWDYNFQIPVLNPELRGRDPGIGIAIKKSRSDTVLTYSIN
jgi:hypothetical protein